MELNIDALQNQIPSYLTKEAKEHLVKALNDFNKKPISYYTNLYPQKTLQGDGWTGLDLISIETAERKQVKGIFLTNSCDIDPNNKQDLPPNIVFAPIIKLSAYAKLLEQANITKEKITNKLNSIREQKMNNIFYLPKGASLQDEYAALLDDIHSVTLQIFTKNKPTKIFTLSQVGFYLFLFKLSVHFCRFHENVARDEI